MHTRLSEKTNKRPRSVRPDCASCVRFEPLHTHTQRCGRLRRPTAPTNHETTRPSLLWLVQLVLLCVRQGCAQVSGAFAESPPRFGLCVENNMLTPTSTALAIPGFIAAPPIAPAVLAERMKLSRRRCAPVLSLSPLSWTSSLGSALPRAHGDVAPARHTRPTTALYAIGRDFLPPARYSPLHSAGPAGWSGGGSSGSSSDESCFASRPLGNQEHTTSPTTSRSVGGRRRRSSSTRLGGLRKPRNADGPRSDGGGSDEEAGGGGDEIRPSRSQRSYRSSVPASKRQPPAEEDIWSKHSVFEFKRCGVRLLLS